MAEQTDVPDLSVSQEAREFVRDAHALWEARGGDHRQIALAFMTHGEALLMLLDGRADHIDLYRRAAEAVDVILNTGGSA